jgi:hypothetical protein
VTENGMYTVLFFLWTAMFFIAGMFVNSLMRCPACPDTSGLPPDEPPSPEPPDEPEPDGGIELTTPWDMEYGLRKLIREEEERMVGSGR